MPFAWTYVVFLLCTYSSTTCYLSYLCTVGSYVTYVIRILPCSIAEYNRTNHISKCRYGALRKNFLSRLSKSQHTAGIIHLFLRISFSLVLALIRCRLSCISFVLATTTVHRSFHILWQNSRRLWITYFIHRTPLYLIGQLAST